MPRTIRVVIDDGNSQIISEENIEFVKIEWQNTIVPVQPVIPPINDSPQKDLEDSMKEAPPKADSWYKTKNGLWYYFLSDGVRKATGWKVDRDDNQTYYLDPVTGIMAVGWTNIDGSWYYFNENHNNEPNWYDTGGGYYDSYGKKVKSYGSMYRDEITPD